MPSLIQPSFAKGEIDPALQGRVDTAAYQVALAKARNVIIHSAGGVSNRPGTIYIGPVEDHTETPRLIQFKFRTTDQYTLEFGDLYMRVIRNDAHVLDATVNISAATKADPVVVTTATHSYSTGDEVFIDSAGGMTEINGRRFKITVLTSTTFSLQDIFSGLDVDGSAYTTYTSGGTSGRIFTLTTPYALADLRELSFTQSGDIITITHRDYEIKDLTRTDHNAWTLTAPTIGPELDGPGNIAATVNSAGSSNITYIITSINRETGEESLPGRGDITALTITGVTTADPAVVTTSASHSLEAGDIIKITSIVGMVELNARQFVVQQSLSSTTFSIEEDSTNHTAYTSAGSVLQMFESAPSSAGAAPDNDLTWDVVTGASKYKLYKRNRGSNLSFGFLGEATGVSFTDTIDAAAIEDGVIVFPSPRNPFAGAENRPATSGYYQQRKVYGGSISKPDTNFYSKTGNPNNFNKSEPEVASDPITAAMASGEYNQILSYIPGPDLLVLTTDTEWITNSGENVGFEADTLFQDPHTFWGSSLLPPIKTGDIVVFMATGASQVRSIGFSADKDQYSGSNLSELAQHLFEVGVGLEWAYTKSPEGRIHIVRDDGVILTVTLNPDQEVLAWSTWDTPGSFESISVQHRQASATEDAIYVVAKRTINGNTVRYIERTHSRLFTEIEDVFFVDSGLSLDSPFTITDATAADPVVITTSAAHGFSNADEVIINGIEWVKDVDTYFNETNPDQLNGRKYLVANKTATTFELTDLPGVDIDGSAYSAYVSGGEVRATVTSLSGLEHLANTAVSVLMDGNVDTSLTVSATGTLTLPSSAGRVHVGLRYVADVETLNPESPRDTIQGKKKKISDVTARFKNSRGLYMGPDFNNLSPMKFREFEKMGEPTQLKTGDLKHILKPSWKSSGRFVIRQIDPLPFTLLAVIPKITLE